MSEGLGRQNTSPQNGSLIRCLSHQLGLPVGEDKGTDGDVDDEDAKETCHRDTARLVPVVVRVTKAK